LENIQNKAKKDKKEGNEGVDFMNPLYMLENLGDIEKRLMIWLMQEKN
jgi:hypothetical protein